MSNTFCSNLAKLVGLGSLLAAVALAVDDGTFAKKQVDSFIVIGLQVRTRTAQELNGQGLIAPLWRRLREERVLERIPNRAGGNIIAVYSDFEGGKDGLYNYLLGARVNADSETPAGMVSKHIAAGSYDVFTAEGGLLGDMIIGLWRHVWELEKTNIVSPAYKTDFEVHYAPPADDPKHLAMDLFVSVKDKP